MLSAGINFYTVIFMTKNMSIEDFGIVGLFMTILYILPQLISFSSIGLVSINKVKLQQNDFKYFVNTYFSFGLFIFIGIILSSAVTSFFFDEYKMLFIVIPIIAFLQYLTMFHNAELIQEEKSKLFGVYRLILTIMAFIFTYINIKYFYQSWDGRVYALVMSEFFLLMISLYISFDSLKNFKFQIDKLKFKEYLIFGLPLIFGLFAGWLLNQADRFIVLHFFSLKEVGVYTLAYSIGTIINIINQAVTNAIVPTIYNALEKKEGHKIIAKLNIYYSLFILTLSIISGLFSFWYVPLFFGVEYRNSPYIILFISLAFALNGVYRTTGSVIAFYKQNTLQMKILYGSAIINVVLSILFIPIFSMYSPAIATLIAYIYLAISSYVYGWKILKKEEIC